MSSTTARRFGPPCHQSPHSRDVIVDVIVDVSVTIDGATTPVVAALDGRAMDIDPGEHRSTFTSAAGERKPITSTRASLAVGGVFGIVAATSKSGNCDQAGA